MTSLTNWHNTPFFKIRQEVHPHELYHKQSPAPLQHVPHPQQGYQARGDYQKIPLFKRNEIPQKRQEISRTFGYHAAKVQNCCIRQRTFLTPTRRVQVCQQSNNKRRLLEKNVRKKRRTRCTKTEGTSRARLESHYSVGKKARDATLERLYREITNS